MSKKIRLLIFLWFIFISTISFAQQYQFAKSIGGTGFENAMGIALDSNRNIIVCGYFAGTADFNPSATASDSLTSTGFNDVFVAKYDSAGNYLWAIQIGGVNDEFTYSDPLVDAAGNIYVCGTFSTGCDFDSDTSQFILNGNGSFDGFISKYDAAGNFIWAKSFGSPLNDQVYRIDLDNAGDILFGGSFDSIADLNPSAVVQNFTSNGESDFFFGRLDATGNLIWVNAIGGLHDDNLNNITHDANNNLIVIGSFVDSADFNPSASLNNVVIGNSSSSYIAKYDTAGNYLWAFPILNSIPFGLSCDNSNNILTCGEFSGTADFNPGSVINQMVSSSNSFDVYFARYDAAGNYVFAKKVGGTNTDNAYAIRELHDSTLLITGYFFGTVDFNPGAATNNLTVSGFGDLFVANYDNTGNYINAFKCGGAGFDFCRNFTNDDEGNIFIAGGYEQTVDFNPAAAVNSLVSVNNSRDGFFAKYGSSLTSVKDLAIGESQIKIYPNPFANYIVIDLKSESKNEVAVSLFDVAGKNLFKTSLKSGINYIDLQDFKKGVYFIKVNNSAATKVIKLSGN